ncbi:hypothetical protein QQS21_010524 [Conoideocrella luteorostrata]|uniref:N-acetyltransferase domain-containing protein n=1 Tax=Conoideocrella luteorostrata TaxID=1105319 RepID=A0AAJ0FUL6_9HYPO|nr:hypothetical protein QQS21_010524 [Conoideocrella luteorostrata]
MSEGKVPSAKRVDERKPRARAGSKTTPMESEYPPASEECAIGDSDEDDEEMVQVQRTNTQNRIQRQNSPDELRRKLIPFHWGPMLHPLIAADLDACVALEHGALPDQNQAYSGEQIEYYLRKCGGLCFGLFNTYPPNDAKEWRITTLPHARAVETGRQDGSKSVMFAHIVASLGKHSVVTDDDLRFPPQWRDAGSSSNPCLGHQISGRTICLHSFSVCPEVQGVGIGKLAMKAYIQLINKSGVADRIALICKEVASLSLYYVDRKLIHLPSPSSASSEKSVSPTQGRVRQRWLDLAGTTWYSIFPSL